MPAPRKSEADFLGTVSRLYGQYAQRIDGIGISMAGKLDAKDGTIISSGQYPFLQGKSLVNLLKTYCPTAITVRNDAHCAALAELEFGCLTDVKYAVVLVLGTGIGGAVILNREIYEGRRFCAAEFSLIRANGEAHIHNSWMYRGGGAVGLINLVKEALHTEEELTGIEIFRMAEEKNETVLKAIEEYCRIMAVQIYNLQAIFDVETFAIGGGISAQPMLLERIRNYLSEIFAAEERYGLPPTMPDIVACKYRDEANLLGAWHDVRSRG